MIKEIGEIPYCQCKDINGNSCGLKVNIYSNYHGSYIRYKNKGYPKFIVGHQNKGYNNPQYGKPSPMKNKKHKPESIDKMKLSNKHKSGMEGKKHKFKTKEIMKKHSAYKGKPSIMKGKHHTEESKNKIKEHCKRGKEHPWYGKPSPHPKKHFEHLTPSQGILKMFRWEYLLACYYDKNNIKYYYEPKAFHLILNEKECTYIPDFYLPSIDEYIEVKGYWRGDAKEKFDKFLETYPNIKIQLLMEQDLKNLGVNL